MLRTFPSALIGFLRMTADFAAVLAAFGIGLAAYHLIGVGKHDPRILPYVYLAVFAGAVWVAIFRWMGLYAPGRSSLNIAEVERLFIGYGAGALVLIAATFFSRIGQDDPPSRLVLLYSLVLTFPLLRLERFLLGEILGRVHGKLGHARTAMIVGTGEIAQQLRRALERTTSPRFRIVTVPCTTDSDPVATGAPADTAALPGRHLQCIENAVNDDGIDSLFVADAALSREEMFELQKFCEARGITFSYVPDLFEVVAHDVQVTELDSIPLIMRRVRGRRRVYLACKRVFDVLFSTAALVVLSPAFAVLAMVIRRDSPGPVFFSHERVGRHGRGFRLHKFRTMVAGTDPYAPSPRSPEDPRITRIGRFLRRNSLDELPQLYNILKGDMSVVGPRPEMPFIVERYTPAHRTRLQVKPGLTGVWQISSHRSADIHEVMDYDVYYVENQSFVLDMLIILETVFYMLSGRGGC